MFDLLSLREKRHFWKKEKQDLLNTTNFLGFHISLLTFHSREHSFAAETQTRVTGRKFLLGKEGTSKHGVLDRFLNVLIYACNSLFCTQVTDWYTVSLWGYLTPLTCVHLLGDSVCSFPRHTDSQNNYTKICINCSTGWPIT